MIWVLTVWHILIIIWLISIGVYWLALIPATILIVLLGYMISSRQFESWREEWKFLLRQWAFLWAWSLFIVWVRTFGDIVWNQNYRWIGLVWIQIAWWLVAIVLQKYSAVSFFHWWYYLNSILVFVGIWWQTSWSELIQLIASWWWLTIGVYAFIVFVVGSLWYQYNAMLKQLLRTYILIELLYFVLVALWSSVMIWVLLSMLLLLLVLWCLHDFQKYWVWKVYTTYEDQEDFYTLLYGKSTPIVQKQSRSGIQFLRPLLEWMYENKKLVLFSIAISMTVLLLWAFWYVGWRMSSVYLVSIYAIIFTYCGGWVITRQWSNEWHRWRRITLVWVLFTIYLTLTQRLGNETTILLVASVPISIWISLFLLYETAGMRAPLLDEEDRRAWLSGIMLVVVLISILFFQLPFSNQLIFALLSMYWWVQWMILRYIWKSVE